MKNKGFTLIELLAVIVILAIIALIATPIILNIIGDTKDSSVVRSGELYLSAVETAIARENLKGKFDPAECAIENDGNLTCGETTLKIETTGSRPTTGTITIVNGKISKVENMSLDGYKLTQENGKIVAEISNDNKIELNPQGSQLMEASFSLEDGTFLGGTINKNTVESIVVANTNKVPSNAIASWDVSSTKDGSVIAWYTDVDNNNLYELYIGGEGGVKANQNSSFLFMFFTSVKIINVEYLDTSEVTNMEYMFSDCSSLTSLNLSNFNTFNVTTMDGMFENCKSLTTLDLSKFDTFNVTTMATMFSNCSNLITLDVSKFNTSQVTNMNSMFQKCSNLTTLDLSNFDTSKVKTMISMFNNCNNLTTIDFRKATFSSVTSTSTMFSTTSKLMTVYVKDEDAKNFINNLKAGVALTV